MKRYNLKKITNKKIKEGINKIQRNGGKVYDDDSFSFQGIAGYYEKENNDLIVCITSKPFFLGWENIEKVILKFFRKNK